MRIAVMIALMMAPLSAAAFAQIIVTSPKPDQVAVTVYRSDGDTMNLSWLNGFAMVSETRHVTLPAGEVDLRFEGVTGGIIPQSAIVTGLGDALVEKNRDAMLLSPGTLLAALLGQRVHLRRTSLATGKVAEQDVVLRSGPAGVVLQTESGFEALRCSGLSETIRAESVPKSLSAKPTLSSRLRLARPVEATVTLSYLTNNFDWRAHYVGTLAPDGKTMSLFAWLTMANGDATSLSNAQAMAVAGRLNRERVDIPRPEVQPITLSCWPSDTTSDVDEDEGYEDEAYYGPPPPPAPPPPAVAALSERIVVTGRRVMAQREALGDLKLYRIPIPVTVAANSQKQVALLEQPHAQFSSIARFHLSADGQAKESVSAASILLFENVKASGLGLPLPAGNFTLFATRDGRPFLLGEGHMDDRAEGERVELPINQPSSIRSSQRQIDKTGGWRRAEVVVSNDSPTAEQVELIFNPGADIRPEGQKLSSRDGQRLVALEVAGNSLRTVRYRWRTKN